VQMLNSFMVLFVSSSMLAIVMVMVHVAAFVVFLHVVHMVFVLMGMLVSSRMYVLVMFVMFALHDFSLASFAAAFHGFAATLHASC
jgi:hypothetical protein